MYSQGLKPMTLNYYRNALVFELQEFSLETCNNTKVLLILKSSAVIFIIVS